MNDPVIGVPNSISEEWDMWAKEVQSAIEAGYLDMHLKAIAEKCIARNKRLKDGTAATLEPAASPPFPVLVPNATVEMAPGGTTAVAGNAGKSKPAQTQSTGRRKVARGSRKRQYGSADTFRFIDGKLYSKADVKGKTMPYQDASGGHYTLRITGVGDRSAKVEFIDRVGNKVIKGQFVPSNYEDKDPIFMHVSTIQGVINTIQPVQEQS